MTRQTHLARAWYAPPSPWLRALLPLARLFQILARRRRAQYANGQRPVYRAPVPVIVVGNISAGGTGKTPLVAWLAARLQEQGLRPGIISRGYGSKAASYPHTVHPHSPPQEAGDEALLLARSTGCPVVIAPDRPAAARQLLEQFPCDLLLSDDGLQHYALARDIEIAVIDGERGLGNAWPLPAGPLREPPERLREVDFIVCNGTIPSELEGILNAEPESDQQSIPAAMAAGQPSITAGPAPTHQNIAVEPAPNHQNITVGPALNQQNITVGPAQNSKGGPERAAQDRRGQGCPRRSVQGGIHSGPAQPAPDRPRTEVAPTKAHPPTEVEPSQAHPSTGTRHSRDRTVTAITSGQTAPRLVVMQLTPTTLVNLKTGETRKPEGKGQTVHAVAGIGNPKRFFDTLKACGFAIIPSVFRDHHAFQPQDLALDAPHDIVMTAKDAVKCQVFATDRCWYLQVEANLPQSFLPALLSRLKLPRPHGTNPKG